jgi:peptide/nickel transport system substrate-binding protein
MRSTHGIWRLILLLVLASLVLSLVGCGTTSSGKGKQLVVGEAKQYSDTLDTFKATTTMLAHNVIYEGLVAVDKDYKFVPGLAESWETSADGMTWTFKLRKNVKFHDGSAFNAEVVKWWVAGLQKGPNGYMLDPEVVSEVKAVDDYTVQMILKSPFPNMLYNLSTSFSGIMSKVAYEKYGADYGTKYAVGTGPFMLKEWVPNDHVLVERNPNYKWAPSWTKHTGGAKVDSILFRFIPEDATRLVELQAGNVQIMLDPPPAREVESLKKDASVKVLEQSAPVIQFIGFNLKNPLFADIKTRMAIGYAIDRKLIVDTIYQGSGKATSLYLAAELGSNKGVEAVAPSFDKAKAQALLAQAGWKAGTDGILVADNVAGVTKGTKFEVNYLTYQEDQYKRLAEVTQKMLADVGIKANTQTVDSPTYSAQLKAGTFQMILRQYSWDNADILEWFHHSKNLPNPNYIGVNDKKFDAMLDEANYKTATFEERDVKYQSIQKYLVETWYPWAPIRQTATTMIWRTTVKDFVPLPLKGASSTYVWLGVDVETK